MLAGMLAGVVVLFILWYSAAVAWTWYAFVGAAVTAGVALAASLALDPAPAGEPLRRG
jgi:hypothetical protein